MKTWQIRFERALSDPDAPPVLTRDLLMRFARTARAGESIPDSSLTHWLREAVARDKLKIVQRSLYLNHFRFPPGEPPDAAPLLRTDAIVSLNTVLGDAGVLNNPSATVTAVVPIDRRAPPPSLGRQHTGVVTFHLFGLPRRVLETGDPDDRLELPEHFEHPRATPEKALIDWLYLSISPRSKRTAPSRGDVDVDMLNLQRLHRLAKSNDLVKALNSWMG